MKSKFYFAFFATLLAFTLSSCNSAEMIIQAEVKAANQQCPMSLGSGLTMTAVEYNVRYVTYYIKGDESIYSFNQSLVTPALKQQLISTLKQNAAADDSMERLLNALNEKHVGIIYHYYTNSSSMDVVINSLDLVGVEAPAEYVPEEEWAEECVAE